MYNSAELGMFLIPELEDMALQLGMPAKTKKSKQELISFILENQTTMAKSKSGHEEEKPKRKRIAKAPAEEPTKAP